MHAYATDSVERRTIPLLVAAAAVAGAWVFSRVLDYFGLSLPWWIDAPSTMGFYGVFYRLFDARVWRLSLLRHLGLVTTPILEGRWRGFITSSFDVHAREYPVEVRIRQTWSRMTIRLQSDQSRSHSLIATLLTEPGDGILLSYQYQNEPAVQAKDSMEIHRGTARLYVEQGNVLSGDYYSGRGRQNVGRIRLEKVDGSPL